MSSIKNNNIDTKSKYKAVIVGGLIVVHTKQKKVIYEK